MRGGKKMKQHSMKQISCLFMSLLAYRTNRVFLLAVLGLVLGFAQSPATAQKPLHMAAKEGNYPVKISEMESLLWQKELPGKGASTPIVWNNQIYLNSGVGEGEDGVLCLEKTGKQLSQTSLGKQSPGYKGYWRVIVSPAISQGVIQPGRRFGRVKFPAVKEYYIARLSLSETSCS
jgi:hypothetical protein